MPQPFPEADTRMREGLCIGDNLPMDANPRGPRLILVCGLPGSGKTTLARELEASLAAIRFCPDEWMDALSINLWEEEKRARIEAMQWKLAQQLLAAGSIVIIEWGTWARAERDTLRNASRQLGASVELHYVTAPVDVLLERLARRAIEKPPIRKEELTHWAGIFEPPTAEELALYDQPLTLARSSEST